jgi:lysophospholipase L1-like esterase
MLVRGAGVAIVGTLLAGCALLQARPEVSAPSGNTDCPPPIAGSSEGAASPTAPRPAHDWAWLCRYQDANAQLAGKAPPAVLFFGDSITERWIDADPEFFGPERVQRGISGQTSAQMLLRFYQDVVALRPEVLHLLSGTNDIAANAGAMGPQAYRNNMRAMVDLARAHGITVVIGSILPAERFYWRPHIQPVEQIRAANDWLRELAAERGLAFIDYYSAMATPSGALREDLTGDGVHPNSAGYRLMRELAAPALVRALNEAQKAKMEIP